MVKGSGLRDWRVEDEGFRVQEGLGFKV